MSLLKFPGRPVAVLIVPVFVSVFVLRGLWGTAVAGDWPCILGPNRNGCAENEKPISAWGDSGPKLAWQAEVGEGFAGVAVADSIVVVFHRVGNKEVVQGLQLDSGEEIWSQEFATGYRGTISPDSGPRCVPTISNGRVVVFGAAGDMHCMQLTDGTHFWSRDLHADFDAEEGYFGAGSSPLIFDSKVFVNVGGTKGGIVALNLDNGKTLWAETKFKASYSSPIVVDRNDGQAVLFVTRFDTIAVEPDSGKAIFTLPFGQRGPTVNGATPLVDSQRLFLSASYGIGAALFDISGEPQEVWANDKSLSSQYTTAIFDGDFLYGCDGREDAGAADLRCVDAKTGTAQWSHTDSALSHLIRVGGNLIVWSVDGKLRLVKMNADGYEELAAAQVFERDARAIPAYSRGRLIVRSNASGGKAELKVLDLASSAESQ